MTDYATATELGTYLGAALGAANAGNAALVLTAASRAVDSFTGRDFSNTTTASTMSFEVRSLYRAFTRDFASTTDLVVALDNSGDGTPDTTLTTADYQLYPLNQYVNGIGDGVAYSEIRLVSVYYQQWYGGLYRGRRPLLYVTAKWGWAAVPDVIKRATLMLAADMLQDPTTPFGVFGLDQLGAIRVRNNGRVAAALQPFVRAEQAVMVA